MKVVCMADHNLNNLYDKYAAAIYGMICRSIEKDHLTQKVLEYVFVRFDKENFQQDPGFFKVMIITRETICSFIKNNKAEFMPEESMDCSKASNDYIFQLVCFGRYTIDELAKMLDIEEPLLKRRLHLGMQKFMQHFGTLKQTGI